MNQSYIKEIKRLRKEKKLHKIVQENLIKILQHIAPELHSFKEIQGLAGGRNDLLAFEYNGRKVLFELFASQSQVSRDLRILDKTKADVKIAIIIDKEIDEKVFNKYIRENPEDVYTYFFLKELFIEKHFRKFLIKLHKLIKSEDETVFKAILEREYSFEKLKMLFEQEGLELIDPDNLKNQKITFKKLFNYFIITKLTKFNKNYSLEKVVSWLANEDVCKYVLIKLQYGFNLFLYTDLNENIGLYSDMELIDFLRIGSELDSPRIIISINNIVNSILELKKDKTEKFEVNFVVGYSFFRRSKEGNQVFISIPTNTKEIVISKPWMAEDNGKYLSDAEILEMIKIP